MSYANTTTTSYFVHDTNNTGFYSYKTIVSRYSPSDKGHLGIQVSRHTVMVDRGCWRPRTVHSGVTSDIIIRHDGKGPLHTVVELLFSAADGSSSKQASDVVHKRQNRVAQVPTAKVWLHGVA